MPHFCSYSNIVFFLTFFFFTLCCWLPYFFLVESRNKNVCIIWQIPTSSSCSWLKWKSTFLADIIPIDVWLAVLIWPVTYSCRTMKRHGSTVFQCFADEKFDAVLFQFSCKNWFLFRSLFFGVPFQRDGFRKKHLHIYSGWYSVLSLMFVVAVLCICCHCSENFFYYFLGINI